MLFGKWQGKDNPGSDSGSVVLDQIRISEFTAAFTEGINTITIYPCEAGVVLQQIGVYRDKWKVPRSYMGEEESFWTN